MPDAEGGRRLDGQMAVCRKQDVVRGVVGPYACANQARTSCRVRGRGRIEKLMLLFRWLAATQESISNKRLDVVDVDECDGSPLLSLLLGLLAVCMLFGWYGRLRRDGPQVEGVAGEMA